MREKPPKQEHCGMGEGRTFVKLHLKRHLYLPLQKKCSEGDDKYNFIQSCELQVVIVLKSEKSIHQIVSFKPEGAFLF